MKTLLALVLYEYSPTILKNVHATTRKFFAALAPKTLLNATYKFTVVSICK